MMQRINIGLVKRLTVHDQVMVLVVGAGLSVLRQSAAIIRGIRPVRSANGGNGSG